MVITGAKIQLFIEYSKKKFQAVIQHADCQQKTRAVGSLFQKILRRKTPFDERYNKTIAYALLPIMKYFSDSIHRIDYATDASAYREVPLAVAYPEERADIAQLIARARQEHTHLIPRAAGTSVAGQVVGSGIVVDISRYWNHIIEINAEERWARVEPGVVRDELNAALKPYGLFFSPETSTSNRCCIGGMVGNNSCGTHSLVYGSTRHHLLEAHVVLSDGSEELLREYRMEELEERFGARFWEHPSQSLIESVYSQMMHLHLEKRDLIVDSFPDRSLRRRSCGYAIDEAIEDLPNSINLCRLLAGSEGTLCFITEVKISLDPLPSPHKMVLCAHCDKVEKAFLANLTALRHNPVAIELMDGTILELSKANRGQDKNRFFVEGDPAAIIIAEFNGEDMEQLAKATEEELYAEGLAYACTRVYGNDIGKVWALRKAGLGVLSGMKGDAKPIGVIEDTAVAPARLPEYLKEFREMTENLGLKIVYYGHISTGELHLRPILNIKDQEGLRLFREVARESALLVKKHKGSLSGEHGDGRLRGEFIPLMYGKEVYELMREVKHTWDPDNVFNTGKIVDTPPMDEMLRFEVDQEYAIEKDDSQLVFNWRAPFDECTVEGASGVRSQKHALMCSIEQCNGAGDCRKSNLMGGTMCPAYRVSRNETRTTRARANILREILTRGYSSPALNGSRGSIYRSPELKEALDSCLACKGCRNECPSNVDMTRLRGEVLQMIYSQTGTPLRSFMVARMAMVEHLGSMVAPLYNFLATCKPTARLIKGILRFAAEREIPTLSHRTMRRLVRGMKPQGKSIGKVFLFADEFTNYQEAELGLAFAQLLTSLNYEVEIPRHVESGRAAISKGCLKLAQKFAIRNVELLRERVSDEIPLVGIEPSCILSFRDEYPDLVPAEMRKEAQELGRNCMLFDEFLVREMQKGNIKAEQFKDEQVEIWLHGHCHQKALVGVENTVKALGLMKGANVHVIPSGCCGMAGSFGYEKEHYRTSIAIGEMVLFPAVRNAMKQEQQGIPTLISAPGTSCREQIRTGTGFHAVHPIIILQKYLRS